MPARHRMVSSSVRDRTRAACTHTNRPFWLISTWRPRLPTRVPWASARSVSLPTCTWTGIGKPMSRAGSLSGGVTAVSPQPTSGGRSSARFCRTCQESQPSISSSCGIDVPQPERPLAELSTTTTVRPHATRHDQRVLEQVSNTDRGTVTTRSAVVGPRRRQGARSRPASRSPCRSMTATPVQTGATVVAPAFLAASPQPVRVIGNSQPGLVGRAATPFWIP